MTFLQRDFLFFSQPFPLIYPSGSKTLLNFFLEVEVPSMLHHLTEPLTIVDALPLQVSLSLCDTQRVDHKEALPPLKTSAQLLKSV